MKILVTGNNGYIGTVLCKKLLEEGWDVTGLDTGFFRGCDFFSPDYSIKQIDMDVRDVRESLLAGFDAIIHLAALSNDPMGDLNPALTSKINYLASVDLARMAKKAGVSSFIFSSSCSVYGVAGDKMIDESGMLSPATEYARSKVETEKEVAKLASGSFSTVFLRNATVYGVSPMLRVDLVVNNLVGWAFTTGRIRLMSDGTPWRPLIHVQDLCKAFIAVLKAPRDLVNNQTFNIGINGGNYRIKEIVDAIKLVMPECRVDYTGEHGSDTRTYRVNFDKAAGILGNYFKPDWDIHKGIRELIGAYKIHELKEPEFVGDKFIRLKKINRLLCENKIDKSLFWKDKKRGNI
jgi:Nucleoside-diphosphate-sugar epimerases